MIKNKNSSIILNILTAIILQLFTFGAGMVIPKITLIYFGSEINGIIISINQFLSVISIIEGGIGALVLSFLYLPLVNKDNKKIISILRTANKLYFQIGISFIVYCIVLIIIFPQISNCKIDKDIIVSLIIVLGINMIVQYYFSITNRLLLEADKKGFVVYLTQTIIIIVVILSTVILIKYIPNIIFLKFLRAIIYLIQPAIFIIYIKKNYDFKLKDKIQLNAKLYKKRWSGFGQNLAFFVHSNTDVILLTIFSTFKEISVYSVYSMILLGIRSIIITIKNGFIPILGRCLAQKDIKKMETYFNIYEFIIFNLTIILFGCSINLIDSFVKIYTKNINDTNYYQPLFAYILILSEVIFCIREPQISIDFAAGKFNETQKGAYIEMLLNILLSVILVKKYGLIGVSIGTFVSVIYRLIYHLNYNVKNVIKRPVTVFIRRIFILIVIFILITFDKKMSINTYSDWIIVGIYDFIKYFILVLLMNIIFEIKTLKEIGLIYKSKKKR